MVTTSEFVRRRLVALGAPGRSGVPGAARARRTRLGPSPAASAGGQRDLAEVRARYGIGERYAVYPAITYAHKNHAVLVEALARPEAPADLQLVLSGGVGPAEEALRRRASPSSA